LDGGASEGAHGGGSELKTGADCAARRSSINNRILWHGALARALSSGVAVYDTLFVELAEREGIPLATFDERVLKAYPKIAKRPRDLR